MPIDFPNPADSTTYTNPTNGNVYIYANGSWSLQSILSSARGGTGFASYNLGDILYGNASGTLSKLGAGTAGSVLSTNGTGADPTWIAVSAGGAGTVATPGARYQIAGYYPGTGASVSGSSTFTNDTSTGIVSISHATGSTSTTTGALIITGGVGIGGSLNVGALSKFSNVLEVRSGNELRLYRTADTNYTVLKSADVTSNRTFTLPLTVGSSGQFLTTDGNGVLSFTTDPIQTNSGSANQIAFYSSAGSSVSGSSTFTNDASGGVVSITHTTTSTGFSTGALVVSGGVGIGGSLRIGDSTTSGGTTQGALTVRGGVGIGGALYVGGLLSVSSTTNLFGAISFLNELSTVTIQNRIIKSGSIALSMSGNGTNGAVLQVQQANIKETGIGANSTVASIMPAISFRKHTFSATNSGITYTRAANVYIEDAPDSSVTGATGSGTTNTITITNSYALYVENGRSYFGGAISRNAWDVGEVIATRVYNNTDLGMSATTTINSTTYTNVATITYTPKSTTSHLWIEFDANYILNNGSAADDFFSRITVAGSAIVEKNQIFVNATAGGTRSGVIFPISGRYTNTTTSGIAITVQAKWGTSDDPISVYGNSTSGYMRIQEIGR